MKDVTIYSKENCIFCRKAEAFLKTKGIPFKEIDVTDNDELREKLVDLSGGRTTVPQIFIGDVAIGGYTDMMALHLRGELDAMLA